MKVRHLNAVPPQPQRRGTVEQYAWAFGDEVLELVRAAIRLRYRLLPYP